MQTFLKMSSVVYSMAGLGSVEESKLFRDKFGGSSTSVADSLKYLVLRIFDIFLIKFILFKLPYSLFHVTFLLLI